MKLNQLLALTKMYFQTFSRKESVFVYYKKEFGSSGIVSFRWIKVENISKDPDKFRCKWDRSNGKPLIVLHTHNDLLLTEFSRGDLYYFKRYWAEDTIFVVIPSIHYNFLWFPVSLIAGMCVMYKTQKTIRTLTSKSALEFLLKYINEKS